MVPLGDSPLEFNELDDIRQIKLLCLNAYDNMKIFSGQLLKIFARIDLLNEKTERLRIELVMIHMKKQKKIKLPISRKVKIQQIKKVKSKKK